MFYKNQRIERMHKINKTGAYAPHAVLARRFFLLSAFVFMAVAVLTSRPAITPQEVQNVTRGTIVEEVKAEPIFKTVQAYVTGYNTVEAQTDATPCISASGHDICGRNDVVACPRTIPLGTLVGIDGKLYTCLDRTASKFNDRFDISCDKDMACPASVTGKKEIIIYQ